MLVTLSDEEIIRRLRVIRHSSRSARYGRHILSMNAIAVAAGLARERLHRVVNGEPIGRKYRTELSRVLTCDEIVGERTGGSLHIKGPDRT